jgi:KDO2-lipid IV(A) lauroyltransferase
VSSIERINGLNFKILIHDPINFSKEDTIEIITLKLNQILERMILQKPEQWIWSHNRWK